MTLTDAQVDARLGLLAAYAEDMYAANGPLNLTPQPDPRLSPEWSVRGYVSGLDAVFQVGPIGVGDRVFYGFLAESTVAPGEFAVAIRGTSGIVEWLEDAEFSIVTRSDGAKVEAGFNGIYETMEYTPIGGAAESAAVGIGAAIGSGTVTVVGHSLGAALATYLALDLSRYESVPVKARLFASPRPGDASFADLFATWVKNSKAYAYALDIVPRVPVGFGYAPLECLATISHDSAQARIRLALACFHHVWSYAACLDYSLLNWQAVPKPDQLLTNCISGPR